MNYRNYFHIVKSIRIYPAGLADDLRRPGRPPRKTERLNTHPVAIPPIATGTFMLMLRAPLPLQRQQKAYCKGMTSVFACIHSLPDISNSHPKRPCISHKNVRYMHNCCGGGDDARPIAEGVAQICAQAWPDIRGRSQAGQGFALSRSARQARHDHKKRRA